MTGVVCDVVLDGPNEVRHTAKRAQTNPLRRFNVDEAGVNIAMGRSHAWIQAGRGMCGRVAAELGDHLTLSGAMRWIVN